MDDASLLSSPLIVKNHAQLPFRLSDDTMISVSCMGNCPTESGWRFSPQLLVGRVARKSQPVGLLGKGRNRWDSYPAWHGMVCMAPPMHTISDTSRILMNER